MLNSFEQHNAINAWLFPSGRDRAFYINEALQPCNSKCHAVAYRHMVKKEGSGAHMKSKFQPRYIFSLYYGKDDFQGGRVNPRLGISKAWSVFSIMLFSIRAASDLRLCSTEVVAVDPLRYLQKSCTMVPCNARYHAHRFHPPFSFVSISCIPLSCIPLS